MLTKLQFDPQGPLQLLSSGHLKDPSTAVIATAAAKLAVPNRLCPQPCPAAPGIRASLTGFLFCEIPAFASNSPKIPITGFPDPYFAINAVGISAIFSVTSKPLSRA